MAAIHRLYDLQTLDLETDRRNQRLEEIAAALGNDTTLVQLRGRLAELEASTTEVASQQKDFDLAIATFTQRIAQAEQMLFGSTVKNPRELSGFQADVVQLKRLRSEQEDRLLVVLDRTDTLDGERNTIAEQLRETEQLWSAEQHAMAEEQATLQTEVVELVAKRSTLTPQVSAGELALYEQVRRTYGGKAVARVDRGMCSNCRERLPTQKLRAARTSPNPVRCSSCGLILLAE